MRIGIPLVFGPPLDRSWLKTNDRTRGVHKIGIAHEIIITPLC